MPSRKQVQDERQIAVVVKLLRQLPDWAIELIQLPKFIDWLNLSISRGTIYRVFTQYRKGVKEKETMAGQSKQVEPADNQLVLERIAAIVTKSYVHLGDNEEIGTEDALQMIHREIKAFDPSLLIRNEKKRLPKQPLV